MARATEINSAKAMAVLAAAIDAWGFARHVSEKAPEQIQERVIEALPRVNLSAKFRTINNSREKTAKQWALDCGMTQAALFGVEAGFWKLNLNEKEELAARAAFDGYASSLRALARAGAKLDQFHGIEGRSGLLSHPPLLIAVSELRVEAVRALLDLGCDPDLRFAGVSVSALQKAVAQGQNAREAAIALEIVQNLLEFKADANARDAQGNTPLHWAAFSGRVKIGKALVENGAEWTARNKNNETAVSIASAVQTNTYLCRQWQERNGFASESQVNNAVAQFKALGALFESRELARVVALVDRQEKESVEGVAIGLKSVAPGAQNMPLPPQPRRL